MAKKWNYDEKMLIEIFGCASLNKNIIEFSGYKGTEIYKSDFYFCLLYTSPSPRDRTRSRMPSSAWKKKKKKQHKNHKE